MGLPRTYDETVDALTDIVDGATASGDRAGYFAAMYRAVTTTVRRWAVEGRFEDAARMQRFVVDFAHHYLAAHAAWHSGQPCSASWQAAFDATRRWRPIALQHLLLGMNAHINLDLGVTAAALDPGNDLDAVRPDFETINDILAGLVDACQDALGQVSPWLRLVDHIGGASDETVVRFSLVAARRNAWRVATRLAPLSGSSLEREIASVDRSTAQIARVVTNPGFLASAVLGVVRLREESDPATIIRVLATIQPSIV